MFRALYILAALLFFIALGDITGFLSIPNVIYFMFTSTTAILLGERHGFQ